MIVRMWETTVKPGQTDALIEFVKAEIWPGVTSAEGFLSGEVLRTYGDADADERLLLVTRWQDAASLEGFLGPDWQAHQMTPVPDEEPLLASAPFVDHWSVAIAVPADRQG